MDGDRVRTVLNMPNLDVLLRRAREADRSSGTVARRHAIECATQLLAWIPPDPPKLIGQRQRELVRAAAEVGSHRVRHVDLRPTSTRREA